MERKIIIVLVMSFILGPHEAVPIAALSGLPSMYLQLLPAAAKHSEKVFVLPFGLAAFSQLHWGLGFWLYKSRINENLYFWFRIIDGLLPLS